MRLKPGTTNAEARAAAAAFNKRQEAYRERQRAMNSEARPGTPPQQINPGKPNVMGFPDELARLQKEQRLQQEGDRGPRGEFFNSPEFAGVTNYRGPATRDMYSSKYFGQLGSGTMGKKQDAAYEAYLNRTGQRPGYGIKPEGGLKPEGISNTRLPSPFRRPVAQPDVMGFPDRPMNPGGLGGVPANRPSMSSAEEAFMRNAKSGMSSVNTTTQANMMGTARPSSGGFNPSNLMQGLQSIAAKNNPQAAAKPAFKKGGKVSAKAPVKKAAGGKVATKAPVKKAMGGKVAAKPMSRPVAKAKPMARPMPAMKRGGKVMMKGKYK